MGVAGSGKSTIASALSRRLAQLLVDADDLHAPEAISKMAAGTPLTDEDRAPWLQRVSLRIAEVRAEGVPPVVACSALKTRYRDMIRASADGPVHFVHLTGSRELLAHRLEARSGHFMPTVLLESQLAALEPLRDDEPGMSITIDGSVEEIVEAVVRNLQPVPS